jgi:hypothetical protein
VIVSVDVVRFATSVKVCVAVMSRDDVTTAPELVPRPDDVTGPPTCEFVALALLIMHM